MGRSVGSTRDRQTRECCHRWKRDRGVGYQGTVRKEKVAYLVFRQVSISFVFLTVKISIVYR